jgi:hypothetical protein
VAPVIRALAFKKNSWLKSIMKRLLIAIIVLLFSSGLLAEPVFTITIERNMTCSDNSTMGRLLVNDNEIGRTLELPWRNNENNISRIPNGTYLALIRNDGVKKWRIQLENVNDRKYIQIHIGNYQRQIKGCILVGKEIKKNLNNNCMVTKSGEILEILADEMSKFASEDMMSKKDINIQVVIK